MQGEGRGRHGGDKEERMGALGGGASVLFQNCVLIKKKGKVPKLTSIGV